MPEFKILVEKSRSDYIEALADELRAKGLRVGSVNPKFRQIRGSGDASLEAELRDVDGVEVVGRDDSVQLPPLDEKVPQ